MTAQPPHETTDPTPEPPHRSGWSTLLDFFVLTMALVTAAVLVGRYGVSVELLGAIGLFVGAILAAWRHKGRQ